MLSRNLHTYVHYKDSALISRPPTFIAELEGIRDDTHVGLDGPCPVLDITELLESRVEALHQLKPLLTLAGEGRSALVQKLGLRVQPLLVQVCLCHTAG